jgi:hypothetical protein
MRRLAGRRFRLTLRLVITRATSQVPVQQYDETRIRVGDGSQVGLQHFQRDLAIVTNVPGEVNGRHPALANEAFDGVSPRKCGIELVGRVQREGASRVGATPSCERVHRVSSTAENRSVLPRYRTSAGAALIG